jgi:hypothetical protein
MGEWDQVKNDVLVCVKWMSEHCYFGGYRGSGGKISVRINSVFILTTENTENTEKNNLFIFSLNAFGIKHLCLSVCVRCEYTEKSGDAYR